MVITVMLAHGVPLINNVFTVMMLPHNVLLVKELTIKMNALTTVQNAIGAVQSMHASLFPIHALVVRLLSGMMNLVALTIIQMVSVNGAEAKVGALIQLRYVQTHARVRARMTVVAIWIVHGVKLRKNVMNPDSTAPIVLN